MVRLLSPGEITRMLDSRGLRANKSLGQNFIVDANHLKKIVCAADINADARVLEIGPGIGTLTRELAVRADHVRCIEIDRGLVGVLREVCADLPNVSIVHEDALKADLEEHFRQLLLGQQNKAVVCANLPYYITTSLIMKLLEQRGWISRMVLLMQREVAARIAASAGSPDYGAISVAVAYSARVTVVGEVPPQAFYPRPKVTSALVKLEPFQTPSIEPEIEKTLFLVVKAAFGQRRKTLRNSLLSLADRHTVDSVLAETGIEPQRRGETLALSEFATIAREFASLQKQ